MPATKWLSFLTSVNYSHDESRYAAEMSRDHEYLVRRAREERAAADRATSEKVRELHLELHSRYLEAAGAGDQSNGVADAAAHASITPPEFRIIP